MTPSLALRAPSPRSPVHPAAPPTLSVLVPAYNAAATIGEALESALSQTPAPLEVVVSDDGSEDDLSRILIPFGTHVRVVRGPNGGLAVARNRAAAVARGELLGLLDADDVWLPGRVAALTGALAARPDLAVVTTDAWVSREGVREASTYYATRTFPVEDQDRHILDANFVFGAGAVRRDVFWAVGGYDPAARWAEDWDLWLRLLLRGHLAGLVTVPLYEYRRSGTSLTGQRVDLARGVLRVLERAAPLLDDRPRREALARTQARWRAVAARAAEASGDPRRRRLAAAVAVGRGASTRERARFLAAAAAPDGAWRRLRGLPA